MGKRGRDHSKTHTPISTRSVPRFALSPSVAPTNYRAILDQFRPVTLTEVEDRRTHHPLGSFRPPRTVSGVAARVGLAERTVPARARPSLINRKLRSQTKALVAFQEPNRVVMCIRRKQRRQVLHAKGIAGSRMRMRSPRKNAWSSISCR